MEILKYPNDLLRQRCDVVYAGDISDEMISQMIDTMYANSGVGLAAPQVGITKAMFVFDPTGGERNGFLEVVINPEILEASGETQQFAEGCLSIPGVSENVNRSVSIMAKYTNGAGVDVTRKLAGFPATVFQHEFDHLSGKLFIDHISPLKRKLLLSDYTKASK